MQLSAVAAAWRMLRPPLAAAALLSLCCAVPQVYADGGGFYLGASGGATLDTYRHADLDAALVANFAANNYDLALSSSTVHDTHTPWSVEVGYRFTPYFGLEASYLELGTVDYTAAGKATAALASSSETTTVDVGIKSRGPALALLGVLPLTDAFGLEARLGAYEGKTLTQFAAAVGSTPSSGLESQTSASLLASLGAQYLIGAHWIVRLDYTRLNQLGEKLLSKSFDVDLLTAGVIFAF